MQYFLPQNHVEVFEHILLSSAIMGMGQKIKLLNNIENFNANTIADLRVLNSIRNGIAHNNTSKIPMTEKSASMDSFEFSVLNSQGKLVTKNFGDELENFTKLHTKVMYYVEEFTGHLT